MKRFEIFRYLKSLRYFVLIFAIIASSVVYFYVTAKQQYTAEAIIEYTSAEAKYGHTPAGTNIDPTEIYSAAVITDVIEELKLHTNVDTIRASCHVKEVLTDDEQKRKDAKIDAGEDYTIKPTKYRVTFTANKNYSLEYVRDVLDSILSNYFAYYSRKNVDTAVIPNNIANISTEKYDYLDCVEMLDKSAKEMESYLEGKSAASTTYRSSKTGYSFLDLYNTYHFINSNTIPRHYATVFNSKLTSDRETLIKRHKNRIANYDIKITDLTAYIDQMRALTEKFGAKVSVNSGATDTEGSANSTQVDESYILHDVNRAKTQGEQDITTQTTYDTLIDKYVKSQSERATNKVNKAFSQSVITTFTGAVQTSDKNSQPVKQITSDINATTKKLNDLYIILKDTVEEFNQYQGALNIRMVTSPVVEETVNVKLLLQIAIVLSVIVGGLSAIVLGRIGDFIDVLLYVDRKMGIANRTKCDLVIEDYSKQLLDDNFSCMVFNVEFDKDTASNQTREQGDLLLQDFAKILSSLAEGYGFVGYNNTKQFMAFFEDCSAAKAQTFVDDLYEAVRTHNAHAENGKIEFTYGISESKIDSTYKIRDLLRLALQRQNNQIEERE